MRILSALSEALNEPAITSVRLLCLWRITAITDVTAFDPSLKYRSATTTGSNLQIFCSYDDAIVNFHFGFSCGKFRGRVFFGVPDCYAYLVTVIWYLHSSSHAALLKKSMNPPASETVQDALETLEEMNASHTDAKGKHLPTLYGQLLVSLPLSLEASVLVVRGGQLGYPRESAVLAAILDSTPNPILKPFGDALLVCSSRPQCWISSCFAFF